MRGVTGVIRTVRWVYVRRSGSRGLHVLPKISIKSTYLIPISEDVINMSGGITEYGNVLLKSSKHHDSRKRSLGVSDTSGGRECRRQ